MNRISIALCQTELKWEKPEVNRKNFEQRFDNTQSEMDIIVLPEMFTTGFSMEPQKVAEVWPGETVSWLKKTAKKHNCAICGSIMVQDENDFFNRFIWVDEAGNVEFYDKRHLFQMGGEHEVYTAGTKHKIINYKGWRIAPFVCYDLRFPVWSRNIDKYDLAIYVANWPAARSVVWEKLLMARAIENQCYVAGVNRVGTDGRDIFYNGNSMLINARGEVISDFKIEKDEMRSYNIELDQLREFRKKFPVFDDADDFEMKI